MCGETALARISPTPTPRSLGGGGWVRCRKYHVAQIRRWACGGPKPVAVNFVPDDVSFCRSCGMAEFQLMAGGGTEAALDFRLRLRGIQLREFPEGHLCPLRAAPTPVTHCAAGGEVGVPVPAAPRHLVELISPRRLNDIAVLTEPLERSRTRAKWRSAKQSPTSSSRPEITPGGRRL